MDELYEPYASELEAFGPNWCGPLQYKHQEEALIAVYEPENEDGHRVEVFCTALPARFYRLEVSSRVSYKGDIIPGFTVNTGSGMERQAADIARSLTEGMLAVYPGGHDA